MGNSWVARSSLWPQEKTGWSACEVFAEKGYRAATIADICGRAKANVAAVNYYFGDKPRKAAGGILRASTLWRWPIQQGLLRKSGRNSSSPDAKRSLNLSKQL
ncbi:MAG: helix-turn-helix transcriptional regulator [Deltaproteobacteria bacterium]|nr:helix-turn-helix transcriptional regulator [Deltaproteobacteria bacterium]